jgi:hypothetical protein
MEKRPILRLPKRVAKPTPIPCLLLPVILPDGTPTGEYVVKDPTGEISLPYPSASAARAVWGDVF